MAPNWNLFPMTTHSEKPVAILGAGSWGTALALYLARLGQPVKLWTSNSKHCDEMLADRVNKHYLPAYPFPDSLQPVPELKDAVTSVEDIIIAVPSAGFRNTLILLEPFLEKTAGLISVTKGLDIETGQLLHDVAEDILGSQNPYAVLSGPSFAREVAAGQPTAVVVASQNEAFATHLLKRFNSSVLRVYSSTDIIGVEIAGVVKNVLAIACGISDGMGFGSNARSALITRGLAEMIRLGIALNAKYETFMGLAGLGDLVLTCTDDQSRNRRFGLSLGKGKKPEDIEREIGQVIEGKRNAELVVLLANKHHIEMPISKMVWEILRGKITTKEAMQYLLSREPKPES